MPGGVVVRRGEYLERAVVLPGEPALEGLFHRGRRPPGLVFAPSHPARGGGMESPLIAELAWRLTRAGHPTLRFNYPGVGASGGDFDASTLDAAVARAVEHLQACAPGEVAGIGVGLGGARLLSRLSSMGAGPLVWVMPDLEVAWPPSHAEGCEVTLVLAAESPPELVARAEAWAADGARGAVRWVPGADPSFRRGLVTLGKVVEEILHPPGLVELDASSSDLVE